MKQFCSNLLPTKRAVHPKFLLPSPVSRLHIPNCSCDFTQSPGACPSSPPVWLLPYSLPLPNTSPCCAPSLSLLSCNQHPLPHSSFPACLVLWGKFTSCGSQFSSTTTLSPQGWGGNRKRNTLLRKNPPGRTELKINPFSCMTGFYPITLVF